MTITHHPDDTIMASYAAGTLDLGQHVAVATHLAACPHCRAWAYSLERVCGAMLDDEPPDALAEGALERALARLDTPEQSRNAAPQARLFADAPAQLPRFVKSYAFGRWRRVAPRISLRPIQLPAPSPTRVFLLKSAPGTKMLQHEHSGSEITCVLAGAFVHEGGRFGPGDFDFADETIDHKLNVEPGEDCLCLVALQGELSFSGLLGRLIQPFVRL